MNTEQYVHMMIWLQALTGLIEQMQVKNVAETIVSDLSCSISPLITTLCAYVLCTAPKQVHRDPPSQAVVEEWIREREAMR